MLFIHKCCNFYSGLFKRYKKITNIHYQVDSINYGPESGRSLRHYENGFKFDKNELTGKTVLDLGCGPGARLARELGEHNIESTIISLSPDFSYGHHRTPFKYSLINRILYSITSHKRLNGLLVAGYGEKLCFRDNSFDTILALYSVSVWSLENYQEWFPEICRVLKPGGKAYIGAFHPLSHYCKHDATSNEIDEVDYFIKRMDRFFKNFGFEIEFIPGPAPKLRMLILEKQQTNT